jgi:hypothetical protein
MDDLDVHQVHLEPAFGDELLARREDGLSIQGQPRFLIVIVGR